MYTLYHGKADGLQELLASAKTQPNPPNGFHIESKAESAKKAAEAEAAQAEKFAKENPELALWKNIKEQLTGADGANYFNSGMKDAKLPTLRGKVVKLEPENRPKTLVLALAFIRKMWSWGMGRPACARSLSMVATSWG
jgi:hypothetical protein